MNQRPSRNCLLQLSKRAQELTAKDVVVVAVQASKIGKTKLNDWVKNNKMRFNPSIVMLSPSLCSKTGFAKHLRFRDMKKILHYAMLRSE